MPYMNYYQPPHSDPKPESVQKVDEHRPPQLNKAVCRCRCGCVCSSSREGSTDSNTSFPKNPNAHQLSRNATHNPTNAAIDDDEDMEVLGQEGVEELVETGDLGWYQPQAIERALHRRHQNCWTCTCAGEDPYAPHPDSPIYTAAETAFSSPGAQAGSGPPSMESSMHLSPPRIGSTDLMQDLVYSVREPVQSFSTSPPLCLNPEMEGRVAAHTVYPMELSISSFGDNGEFDFW